MFFPVFSLQTRLLGVFLALFTCNLGCAALRAPVTGYGYFSSPRYDDAWSAKIGAWQRRERAEYGAVSTPPIEAESGMPELAADRLDSSGDLRDKYFVYRAERKRETARSLADWIQDSSLCPKSKLDLD